MKFVFFSVSENGESGLGDKGADGAMSPRIFGLEPPLYVCVMYASTLKQNHWTYRYQTWQVN